MNLTSKGNKGTFSRYQESCDVNIINDKLNMYKQNSDESYSYKSNNEKFDYECGIKVSIDLASKIKSDHASNSASTNDSMIKKFVFNKNMASFSTPDTKFINTPLTDMNSMKNSINSVFELSIIYIYK